MDNLNDNPECDKATKKMKTESLPNALRSRKQCGSKLSSKARDDQSSKERSVQIECHSDLSK